MIKQKLTTIQITEELWLELNKRKKQGESFEEVIVRGLREIPEYIKVKKLPNSKNLIKDIKEAVK